MTNNKYGLPRRKLYADLDTPEYLRQLSDDVDSTEAYIKREVSGLRDDFSGVKRNQTLTLWAMFSLLITVLTALVTALLTI